MHYLEGCAIGSHLRQGVWRRCVDEFYDKLSDMERNFVFHYAVRDLWERMVHTGEETYLKCGEDDFLCFIDCFNPARRYRVTMIDGTVVDAFLHDGKYHVSLSRFCLPEGVAKADQQTERLDLYNKYYERLHYELKGRVEEFAIK